MIARNKDEKHEYHVMQIVDKFNTRAILSLSKRAIITVGMTSQQDKDER